MHTLATAAAAVGRNKTAILRAIKAGRIPVSQAESEIQIDPADLHRIHPPLRANDTQHHVLYQSPLLMWPIEFRMAARRESNWERCCHVTLRSSVGVTITMPNPKVTANRGPTFVGL